MRRPFRVAMSATACLVFAWLVLNSWPSFVAFVELLGFVFAFAELLGDLFPHGRRVR